MNTFRERLARTCWRLSRELMRIAIRLGPFEPDGIPHRRDPDNPCPAYEPRDYRPGDWGDCETDGHYLCGECCHRKVV